MKNLIERTPLVTSVSCYQNTTRPKSPAIRLPTMELPKLTKSLFSQRQGAAWATSWRRREIRRLLTCQMRENGDSEAAKFNWRLDMGVKMREPGRNYASC